MNNNQISNPKKEVASGINLNEKDYLSSFLSCLKEMEKNYVVAITEASNESLYQKYLSVFLEVASLQRDVYELMFRNGWYVLEKADNSKINQKYQTLSNCFSELE